LNENKKIFLEEKSMELTDFNIEDIAPESVVAE